MLTAERLREVLDYDPETGLFTWRIKTCRKVVAGTKAGMIAPDGYVTVGIDGPRHLARAIAGIDWHICG